MSNGSLEGATLKIARARRHILELEQEIEIYRQTKPYSLSHELNEIKPGDAVQIKLPEKVPQELAVIAGDVLHNLRSALDHLVCQLAVQNGAEIFSDVYFPFGADADAFNKKSKRKIRKLSNDAQLFVESLRPYRGGNTALWTLHHLNIIDKHRLLVLVGGVGTMAIVQGSEPCNFINIPSFEVPIPMYNNSFQFTFDISLREPEEYTEPVTITLQRMADMVSIILKDADARFFAEK